MELPIPFTPAMDATMTTAARGGLRGCGAAARGHLEGTDRVHAVDVVEVVRVETVEIRVVHELRGARVVHERIEAPEALCGRGDEGAAVRVLGDVRTLHDHLGARGPTVLGDGFGRRVGTRVVDDDVPALRGELADGRSTDAGRGTGDDGYGTCFRRLGSRVISHFCTIGGAAAVQPRWDRRSLAC